MGTKYTDAGKITTTHKIIVITTKYFLIKIIKKKSLKNISVWLYGALSVTSIGISVYACLPNLVPSREIVAIVIALCIKHKMTEHTDLT